MKRVLTVLAGAAFIAALTVNPLYADNYVVNNVSPAWQQVGTSATWVLPASLGPCGGENEPSCEPVGDFLVNKPIGGITAGYATMTEADGSISDYFVWGNGPNGNGELLFYSDPNAPTNLPSYYYGSMCTEDAVTGCVIAESLLMADGGHLHFTLASDGEYVFDPLVTELTLT